MRSWYEEWVVGKSKHEELLREAERERQFNRLRTALQRNGGARRGQPAEARERGTLAPDRLRPAER